MLHKGKGMTRGSYYFDRNGKRIYVNPINHRFYDNIDKSAKWAWSVNGGPHKGTFKSLKEAREFFGV